MIALSCQKCGKQFYLNPEFAGRRTTCSGCKEPLVVPTPDAESPETVAPTPKVRISFSCNKCGMKFSVMPEFAGRSTSCPTCKDRIVVPSPDATIAYVPSAGKIDGTASSLMRAEVKCTMTLGGAAAGVSSLQDVMANLTGDGARYVIEKELARGGMGAVLRAIDCDIRREVAVKFLLDQSNSKNKIRFVEEAQITGQLEHPNIVPIHEIGVDAQKRIFFSMKMVKGRSLAQILKLVRSQSTEAENYSPNRLLGILVNVCNALAYAHSRGVVHRDLKPANIMVGDFGEVYVMDWGLAKVLDRLKHLDTGPPMAMPIATSAVHVSGTALSVAEIAPAADAAANSRQAGGVSYSAGSGKVVTSRDAETDLTRDGAVLGTPVYMPPEQAAGRIDMIDERSDIYSLGAILYEILTLHPPIDREGGFVAIVHRVTHGEIAPPEKRAPERARAGGIPSELVAVAMKALSTMPADRYQTVEALRRDIELYLEGRSVSAKQDSVWELGKKFVKRNKGLSAGLTLALLVLLGSLVVVFSAWRVTKAEQAEKDRRTKEAVPALLEASRMGVERRNFKNARDQVDLALLYAPDNVEARLLRARILVIEGDFPQAIAELDRYLQAKSGDKTAESLRELCQMPKPNDITNIIYIATLFEQQDLGSFSTALLLQHAESIEARLQLLKPYQKKIEAAWPGWGKKLTMDKKGLLSFDVNPATEIVNLAPLKGIPLSHLTILVGRKLTDLGALQGMPLTSLNLQHCGEIQDLAPLRGMRLTSCTLTSPKIGDFTPLQGMPLENLHLAGCSQIADLEAIRSLPLTTLNLSGCRQIHDLAPLRGMRLSTLNLNQTSVADLSHLREMPLTSLNLYGTKVNDLSPLRGMKLTYLRVDSSPIRDLTPLAGMNLTSLDLSGTAVTDLSGIETLPLTELSAFGTGVHDLTPLRELSLRKLGLSNCGALKDLSPLRGMKLAVLDLNRCTQIEDLSPLRKMTLTELYLQRTKVRDLTPLEGMQLAKISFSVQTITNGMEVLRAMKSLTTIGVAVGGTTASFSPEVFWKKYDAGEFK